jgi:hypothetical protein
MARFDLSNPQPFASQGGGGILGGFSRQAANEPGDPPDPRFAPPPLDSFFGSLPDFRPRRSPPGPIDPYRFTPPLPDPSDLPHFRPSPIDPSEELKRRLSPPGPNVPINPGPLPNSSPPLPLPDWLRNAYVWGKVFFDAEQRLYSNGDFVYPNQDVTLGPNYLDPTPVQGWRPIP